LLAIHCLFACFTAQPAKRKKNFAEVEADKARCLYPWAALEYMIITIIQARVLHLLAGHALTLRLPNAFCGPLAARNDQDPPKPADEQ
jgi:hypothetical protein